jgi:hypothetical protein
MAWFHPVYMGSALMCSGIGLASSNLQKGMVERAGRAENTLRVSANALLAA